MKKWNMCNVVYKKQNKLTLREQYWSIVKKTRILTDHGRSLKRNDRRMRLFLKSNRIMKTNDRIIVILACLRGGVTGIYAQKKLDKLDKETGTQDWNDFV